MQVLGYLWTFGHGVQQFFGTVLGVAGHKANAKIAGQVVNLPQQLGKGNSWGQIFTVAVHILPQERDLFISVGDQLLGLCQHIARLSGALPPPHIRHDAVSAKVVAAVHNGQPRPPLIVPHHRHALGNHAVHIRQFKHPLFAG